MSTSDLDQVSVPPIVTASWLRERRAADASLAICHVGSTMAGPQPEQDFESGHLPGARFVSVDDVLAAPPSGTAGRHPLPAPAEFARALGALGVADGATVVAYDDRGGAFAARMVWMLRLLGQHAALLDGGIEGWIEECAGEPGGDLELGPASPIPVDRAVHEWPLDSLADAIDVARHVLEGGVVIDSRDPSRYVGELEPVDAVAGHVPGAVNLLYGDNLDNGGRFLSAAELHARFAPVVGDDARPIVYCGSGVTACHNALAMEHAGVVRPRVYVGSWSGWTADPDRPVATGTAP